VTRERVVVVLSGGGMKAMAHIGVARALEESGLTAAEIVGTSGGAMVGALLAAGLNHERLVHLVRRLRARDVVAPARASLLLRGVGAASVLRPAPLQATLRRLLPIHDFHDLVIPLRVTATDLDTGELVIFGAGGRTDCPVPEAVYASMALPVYFPPARIGGRRYADGGLRAVLPLDVAASVRADIVVAVDVGPDFEGPPPQAQPMPALIALQDRALAVALADQKARTIAAWRDRADRPELVLVTPAVDAHATFAFDRTTEFIEAGYRAAQAALAARRAG